MTLVPASALMVFAAGCPGQAPILVAERKSPEEVTRQKASRAVRVTVPAGTEIFLTLNSPVSSASSQAGDGFSARSTDPVVVGSRVVILAGSTVQGRVSDIVPARKGLKEKEGSLSLSFERIVTPSGFSASMSAGISSLAPRSSQRTAGMIRGSSAGGALLGKLLRGNSRDAAVGAVVGGAAGTGIAAGTRGKDVEIPAGSSVTLSLDQPLVIAVTP